MKSSEIWNELGNTYFKAGVLDKAIDAYSKAIEQKSQLGWSYSNLAAIYVQQGRFLDAIPLYQKSLELFASYKDQAGIWGRLGNVYHQLNEYGKAIQAFQKADELIHLPASPKISPILSPDKTNPEPEADHPLSQSVEPMTQVGQDDSAQLTFPGEGEETFGADMQPAFPASEFLKEDLSKVDDGIEQNATTWNELGLILFKVGNYEDAIDAYEKAIELDPAIGYFHSNLGQVYVAQGRLSEALDNYEKSILLLSNTRDQAVCWTRLGDIYRQLSQFDEATAAYQLADALNQTTVIPTNEFRQVNLTQIMTNPGRARNWGDMDDLVISIQVHGIIQPLIVCPVSNESGKYLLIAGRRRLEAARLAGLKEVPVIVRQANDQEILELSINENIHTAAINPFELAKGYRQMANKFDLTVEEIAARVGRSCHSVANAMKASELPDDPRKLVLDKGRVGTQPLAETQLLHINPRVEPVLAQIEPAKIEINSLKTGEYAQPDPSPALWYIETENESVGTQTEEDSYPENTSLLTRARHVLKGNPRAKRLLVVPSYRA